jgi:hypothetical protein
MLKGIILHPFKALFFRLAGNGKQYDILSIRANYRRENKAFERKIYLSSLTGTNINL